MMRQFFLAAMIATMVQAPAEAAARYSGNDLLADMRDSQGIGVLSSLNYLSGVVDAETLARSNERKRPYTRLYFCLPDGVTGAQVSDVVRQYLEADPQSRHFSAIFPVTWALLKAFPCADNPR